MKALVYNGTGKKALEERNQPDIVHLERLWNRNIAITTRLVDTVTTPMLLKTVQPHRSQTIDHPSLQARQYHGGL